MCNAFTDLKGTENYETQLEEDQAKEIERLEKALEDIRLLPKSPIGLGEAWLKAIEIIEQAKEK